MTAVLIILVKIQQENSSYFNNSQKELKKAYQLFDDTLNGFQIGKIVNGADGEPVYLKAVETDKGREILKQAILIWNPYKEKLQPILKADKLIQSKDLKAAVEYAKENNLKLLGLMNQLTIEQEQVAQTKSGYLQLIQIVGISLALANFFILLSFRLLSSGPILRPRVSYTLILSLLTRFLAPWNDVLWSPASRSIVSIRPL